MNRLQIDSLVKRYRNGVVALDGLTLDVEPGVTGLLGPNGAGKSTLLRIVATVISPTSGSIRWNGIDIAREPDAIRRVLGYLPQDSGVYPNLTAREFLRYIAALKGLSPRKTERRIGELLDELNLGDAGNRALASYSGGMKQRVGIAQALLNDPQVAIVDEPTVGLDPEERARFRELMTGLAADRVILLSTHIVSDIESIAERVIMIARGKVIGDGAPDQLAGALAGNVWEGTVAPEAVASLRLQYTVTAAVRRRDGTYVRINAAQAPPGFSAAHPSLEEAYLTAVQQSRVA